MQEPKPHTIPVCLALHLLPGVANFVFIFIVITQLWPGNLPGVLAFALFANLLVLIPVQLGILFYLARKRGNKGWSLEGVVIYNKPLRFRKYFIWVPVILVATFIIFSIMEPIGNNIRSYFSAMDISDQISYQGDFSDSLIIITMCINILFTAILVPITEELYFRGYLLPRMPIEFRESGPVVHSFLFAVYHFDTPWLVPVRTLGLLPLIFVTRKTRSVMPGIVSHSMVNLYEIVDRATDALE